MEGGSLAGRVLKDYKLLELIGDGGFGEVYRAQNIRHNKQFAVKILHSHLVKSPQVVQRFYGEARTLSSLNHPNIVQMVDFDKEDGIGLYLVLEWLKGIPLDAELQRRKRLSLSQTLFVFRQLMAGLHEAHSQGIVHRDLKPANMMLLPSGDSHIIKLFDFGIALDLGQEERHTKTGMLMGSVRYMSPEQAMGSVKQIDHRTDLYACGIILAECLTGRTPFNGATAHAVVFQHVQDVPTSLEELGDGMSFPPALEAFYQKALAKTPDQRFQSASEFLRELLQAAQSKKTPTPASLPVLQGQVVEAAGPRPERGPFRRPSSGYRAPSGRSMTRHTPPDVRLSPAHSTAPEAFDDTALPQRSPGLVHTAPGPLARAQRSSAPTQLPTSEDSLRPSIRRQIAPSVAKRNPGPGASTPSSTSDGLFQRRSAIQTQRPQRRHTPPASPLVKHNGSATASDEQIHLAQQFYHSFGQSLRGMQLYRHQTEGLERLFRISHQQLHQYHQAYGHLGVSVKPFELFLGGQAIYTSDDEEGGIAYRLFNAGVRIFTLQVGITPDDMVRLGRLFLLSPKELQQEDLVSRLWKESIPHVFYFQLQMNEEGEEEDLDQILAYAEAYAGVQNESRSTVNFRVFSQDDARAEQLWRASDTYRQLFQALPVPSQAEVERLLLELRRESEAIPTKGSQLFYLVLRQLKRGEDIDHIDEYLTTLCDHLFFHRAFGPLAMLLQQVSDMTQTLGAGTREALVSLLGQLLARAASEERMVQLFAYLRETAHMNEEERRSIRVFLTLLGDRVQRELVQQLDTPSAMLRRVILEALICGASQPRQLVESLLRRHQQRTDFLADILYAGREQRGLFSQEQLEECLTIHDHRVQLQAMSHLARHFPASLPHVVPQMLQDTQPSVQRRAIETLCQLGDICAATVLEYVESKSFRKLSQPAQFDIASILGESRHKVYLDWFRDVLHRKSSFLKPSVDQQKRLSIRGLRAYGGADARRILREAAAAKGQSGTIRTELEQTYQNLIPF